MADTEPSNTDLLIVDAHLDLAYNAVSLARDLSKPVAEIREHERQHPPVDPRAGTCMVSWPALQRGRVGAVGGSIFVEPAQKSRSRPVPTYETPDEAYAQGVAQLDYYRRISDECDAVQILTDVDSLDGVLASWEGDAPVVGVFVVMEGADPIREPSSLEWWVERGLRGLGLAWSAGTRYAGGNANPGPLTDEGEALLHAMADYNLLLDLSHLWEDAAHRALDRYPGPVVATHANPRRFVDSPRLLTDDMICRIAEREGVIGVVAYNRMLDAAWRPGEPRPPLSRMVEAVDHICQLTGHAYAVGIGSDLDGGFGLESAPTGLSSVADLGTLADLLRERGYGRSEIQAIMHGNWLRMMRRALEAF